MTVERFAEVPLGQAFCALFIYPKKRWSVVEVLVVFVYRYNFSFLFEIKFSSFKRDNSSWNFRRFIPPLTQILILITEVDIESLGDEKLYILAFADKIEKSFYFILCMYFTGMQHYTLSYITWMYVPFLIHLSAKINYYYYSLIVPNSISIISSNLKFINSVTNCH